MTVRAEDVPGAGRVRMSLSMWNRKSTYFGIMKSENPDARASMHTELVGWWLEQRDDFAKKFAKFLTYWCVRVVMPKSVPWFQLSTVC